MVRRPARCRLGFTGKREGDQAYVMDAAGQHLLVMVEHAGQSDLHLLVVRPGPVLLLNQPGQTLSICGRFVKEVQGIMPFAACFKRKPPVGTSVLSQRALIEKIMETGPFACYRIAYGDNVPPF
jgi:hypothetical protein